MQIPYASVDVRPSAEGNIPRINFFRSQGARPNRKALTWQPTGQGTFHVPDAFGTLKLAIEAAKAAASDDPDLQSPRAQFRCYLVVDAAIGDDPLRALDLTDAR